MLAANLRRAFSGIVAGNVKEQGVQAIEAHGPYELHGDKEVMTVAGRAAGGVRRAETHETGRRIPALLPAGRMSNLKLTYRIATPDSRERVFNLELDHDTAQLTSPTDPNPPAVDRAVVQSMRGLSAARRGGRSIARRRCICASVIDGFADLVSYDKVRVTVESEERAVIATLSAQQALASLMGLIMASSGCPRTAVFRPMARFHLPFSSESETAYRVAAMYLRRAALQARATAAHADLDLEESRERLSRHACGESRHGAAIARCKPAGCDRQCDRAARCLQQPRARGDSRNPRRNQACVRGAARRILRRQR